MKYRIPAVAFAVLLAAACSNDPTSPSPSPAPQFDAQPPTNGGNGAGSSGQCTGPQADRPSSCQSQGGPGNQP